MLLTKENWFLVFSFSFWFQFILRIDQKVSLKIRIYQSVDNFGTVDMKKKFRCSFDQLYFSWFKLSFKFKY